MPQPGPSPFSWAEAETKIEARKVRAVMFRTADGLTMLGVVPEDHRPPFIYRTLDVPDANGRRVRAYERVGTEWVNGRKFDVFTETPPSAPQFKCSWVTSESGTRPTWCCKRATHKCMGADAYFCANHAADYEDCFGDATTKTIQ